MYQRKRSSVLEEDKEAVEVRRRGIGRRHWRIVSIKVFTTSAVTLP